MKQHVFSQEIFRFIAVNSNLRPLRHGISGAAVAHHAGLRHQRLGVQRVQHRQRVQRRRVHRGNIVGCAHLGIPNCAYRRNANETLCEIPSGRVTHERSIAPTPAPTERLRRAAGFGYDAICIPKPTHRPPPMLELDTHPSGRHFLQIPGPTNVPDRVLRAIDQPTIPTPTLMKRLRSYSACKLEVANRCA